MMAIMRPPRTGSRLVSLVALAALLVGACSSPAPTSSPEEAIDVSALAAQACQTVDGSAHAELAMAEAWLAQATDREDAADAAQRAADQDPAYEELADSIADLAEQTRLLADQFASGDADALVESLTEGGGDALTAPLVDARKECVALALPTQ